MQRLPPIFKFSVICNILPFLGHLHEWKRLLESINKKSKQLWIENKQALINCGKKYKSIQEFNTKESYQSISRYVELFKLKTYWFYGRSKSLAFRINNSWRFKNLLKPLLDKIEQGNAIVISRKYHSGEYVYTLTENDAKVFIPSKKWTSAMTCIKKFRKRKGIDLCRYILKQIKCKKVMIKKLDENFIEVNALMPNYIVDSQEYNLLNENAFRKIQNCFSWPISNWIWKPKSLRCSSNFNSKAWNLSKWELRNEMTEEILKMTYLKDIQKLEVDLIQDFTSIHNLAKVAEKFPQLNIQFEIDIDTYNENRKELIIETKQITWVSKGKIWNVSFSFFPEEINLGFTNLIAIEENIVILTIDKFEWFYAYFKLDCYNDTGKITYINKLKSQSKFTNDFYVIANMNELVLTPEARKLKEYTPYLKYCKLISIEFSYESKSKIIQTIKEINKLPKQLKYKIEVEDSQYFSKIGGFNLIDSSFEDLVIIIDSFEIRIENYNRFSDKKSNKRGFRVKNNYNKNESIVGIKKLKEMISDMSFNY